MSTGRTNKRHARFYMDGYDMSGYARSIGPMVAEFDAKPDAALTDAVRNVMLGVPKISVGAVNGFFDNTASLGLHVVANGAGVKRVVMCPIGIQAAPAAGDPVFMGQFEQLMYQAQPGDGFVTANIPFGEADAVGVPAYVKPWGFLVHPKGTETAVSAAAGVDDNGATVSALGGFMVYQVFSSDGTVTVKLQDATASNLDASFADLSGATSGSIDASVTPKSGLIALGTTAAVRKYIRWQIVLGTATTVTFALAFMRANF